MEWTDPGTAGDDGGTGQFANWNGPNAPYETGQGYTVWVLTLNANPAGGVTLHLPSGGNGCIDCCGNGKPTPRVHKTRSAPPDCSR